MDERNYHNLQYFRHRILGGGLLPLKDQYFGNKESLESDIDSSINIII